jgi:uncharacterized protein (DUF1778 family)
VAKATAVPIRDTVTSPIRVDQETDDRITHAASLLGLSKKTFVAQAVRAYVEEKAPELDEGLRRITDLLAPANIVVSPSTMSRVADLIENPPKPTRRLRELRDS